ncbi:hypothetical protein IPC1135_29940 [Pseudomonas aeruginosa]|nr:hypothetical protein IPC1135_29940 [Pseudomonas aeruginosa]
MKRSAGACNSGRVAVHSPRESLVSHRTRGEQTMGTLQDRYAIYVEQAKQLGWEIKSFEEWLNS